MHSFCTTPCVDMETNDEEQSNWQTITTTKRKQTESPKVLKKKPATRDQQVSINISRTQQTNAGTSTSNQNNRFDALSIDDEEATQEEIIPKPPPIFIPNVNNIYTMITKLKNVISSEEFNYKSVKHDEIRLMIKSIDSYRKVIKYFDSLSIVYHSFQLKQERAFRVVIKGLHSSTPIDDIKAELISRGHPVRSITNIKSRITKEPLSMFFVDLNPSPDNKKIYDIKHINHAVVRVEPPKRSFEVVQCHRCQQFGHTKSYCKKPYRCVKCGMDHPTAECKKTSDTPPRCVHCLMNHTSSYRGCKVYQNMVGNRRNHHSSNQNNNRNFHYNASEFPNLKSHNNDPQFENRGEYSYANATRTQSYDITRLERLERMMENIMNMMSMILNKQCN